MSQVAAPPVPRWAVITTFLLSLAGLGVATYLTIAHYVGTQVLACSANALVNCEAVTTSAQSHFLGMPVSVLGLGNFLVLSTLCSPWAWKSTNTLVHRARVALILVSIAMVAWLVTAEIAIIGKICLWCTAVHLITFALVLVLTRLTREQTGWTPASE